ARALMEGHRAKDRAADVARMVEQACEIAHRGADLRDGFSRDRRDDFRNWRLRRDPPVLRIAVQLDHHPAPAELRPGRLLHAEPRVGPTAKRSASFSASA